MPFKEIAKALLERGFSVIPLKSQSKEPLEGWGPTKRTRDARALETVAEGSNVGIVADDNFLILETDDESRFRSLIRNVTGHELPITLTSQARYGRPHFFYKQTKRTLEVGNCSVEGLFELRAKNQYVVGPGSVHPTGAVYQIVSDYEVVPMPEWLLDGLLYLKGSQAKLPAGQKVDIPTDGRKLGEGEGRHYLLTTCAGRLWNGKKTYEQLFNEVWEINLKACDPPRSEAHVADIVRWVMAEGEPYEDGPAVAFGSSEVWGKTAEELIDREMPARKVLMNCGETPLLFEKSLNQIFATRGLGKTNFALGLAGALAAGESFLKYKAPDPCRVLYVDGELPLVQLRERIAKFVGKIPNFRYVNAEDLPGCRVPSLFSPDGPGQQKIIEACERHEIQVVIFDSLSTLFHFETNDEAAWINVEEFFLGLRQRYGLCVITLHHAGKAGLQRGHSRGDDLLDVSIKLEKFPDWEPGMELAFQLKYEKVRHGGKLEPFDVMLTEGKWEVNPETAIKTEARAMLKAGKSRAQVMKATDLSDWAVRQLRSELQAEGLIKLNNKGKEDND